ncbi:MAG: hypothetical protein N2110_07350 [Flavobacteriales bacterium]|nr:hypothetical protein [Flavobacteriales bacterium]MCX7768819.1 hypothetical protein [Flavobacteriales bacterium]MDW8410407.1 hypothetical protein [Flavobacteriales bacterium]
MKKFRNSLAVLFFFLFWHSLMMSQKNQAKPDERVKTQLERLGLKYTLSETGNFKVVFDMGNERTQLVVVNSNTYELGSQEIRELYSVAALFNSPDEMSKDLLFKLLELNETYKIGAWQINGGKSPYLVQFAVRLSASAPDKALDELIRLAAGKADEMELELTQKDDF